MTNLHIEEATIFSDFLGNFWNIWASFNAYILVALILICFRYFYF